MSLDSKSIFSFLSSLIKFFFNLTSSIIYIRFEFAFAASKENLSLSFSNLAVSVERASWIRLLSSNCYLILTIIFLSCLDASSIVFIFLSRISKFDENFSFFISSDSRFLRSSSDCFLKYSISRVRAETEFIAAYFSFKASTFSFSLRTISWLSSLLALTNFLFSFSTLLCSRFISSI